LGQIYRENQNIFYVEFPLPETRNILR